MEFDQLALQKLAQTAPELASLVVAFRDISEESSAEEDVNVGVFILRSGGSFYFIPVIRKDQTLYPIDSVFICDLGQFRPLTKTTTTAILTAQGADSGRATKIPGHVMRNPSVYDLVNPPRTGKYVYASSSRLHEFLGAMPDHLKSYVGGIVRGDSDLATGLAKVIELKDLFEALREAPKETAHATEKPARPVYTFGDALSEAQAKEVLEKGYALNHDYPHASRVGIPEEDFHIEGQAHQLSTSTEGGRCYNIVLDDGNVEQGFVLPLAKTIHKQSRSLILLKNGRYLVSPKFVAVGDELATNSSIDAAMAPILARFSEINPVSTIAESLLTVDNRKVALLTPDMNLIGVGYVYDVKGSSYDISFRLQTSDGSIKVSAMKGLHNLISEDANCICVPQNWPVIVLGIDAAYSCVNINAAQKLMQHRALLALGDKLDLRFDGVDFSIDGSRVGPAHKAIEILVADQGFEPSLAESFVKRASAEKRVRVLMSKKADFEPGVMPQFGNPPPPQGSMNEAAVRAAVQSGDKQVAEAMIISELLQAPDLMEVVNEYLPDVSEAVDRLGRILFLSRVRMDQLIEATGNEAAMSTIASIKAVYRNLGDNLVKLEQLSANVTTSK